MTSILTNSGAIAALSTLRLMDSSLSDAQRQMSSGLRVERAADNAAYWSIGTTMRSDNKAMGAVSDAINLGSAKVDVAYSAMESSIDLLDEIKSKLVAASEPGVDRGKVQKEIDQLQDQLQSVVNAASFDGQNWLKANGTAGNVALVTGFTRDVNGDVALQKLDLDLSKTVLLNDAGGGLLQTGAASSGGGSFSSVGGLVAGLDDLASNPATTGRSIPFTGPFTVAAGDSLSFTLTTDNSTTTFQKTYTIDRATVDQALGASANGLVSNGADLSDVISRAFINNGFLTGVSGVGGSSGSVSLYVLPGYTLSSGGYTVTNGSSGSGSSSGTHPTTGVMDMDITQSGVDLDDYLDQIEIMLQSTTDAAADLGAIKSRLQQQSSFTDSLMDSLERGIGTLVDADMDETSTRLKAVQTRQQLSIQALSIANSSSQTILQLFQ